MHWINRHIMAGRVAGLGYWTMCAHCESRAEPGWEIEHELDCPLVTGEIEYRP